MEKKSHRTERWHADGESGIARARGKEWVREREGRIKRETGREIARELKRWSEKGRGSRAGKNERDDEGPVRNARGAEMRGGNARRVKEVRSGR